MSFHVGRIKSLVSESELHVRRVCVCVFLAWYLGCRSYGAGMGSHTAEFPLERSNEHMT